MSLDFVEVKRTLESLNASLGAGKVFYVCPESDSWSSDLIGIQKVSGQVVGTIQQGLDSCLAGRGDTVVVLPGTYTQTGGAATMSKGGTTLMGLPGRRDQTLLKTGVIDENDAGVTGFNTINVMADGCTVKDLTISNGWFDSDPGSKTRICIGSQGAGMTVSGCKLTFDTAPASCMTGIYLSKSDAKILDCHFEDTMSEAAIFMDAVGADIINVLIKGCYFVGVNASTKLALHINDSANNTTNLVVTECLFSTNGAGGAAASHFYDLANGGGGSTIGEIVDNVFTVASIDTAAQMGAKDSQVLMVRNWGIDGVSTAIPS